MAAIPTTGNTVDGVPTASQGAAAPAPDAQALAERTAAVMFALDRASQALGVKVESVAPGRATLAMTVREDMLNGHDFCHGGFIFLLADSTFAYACNSHNRRTVAQGCSIEYLAPAHRGDLLRASGIERSRSGRTGVYDIEVRDQHDRAIALFRGKSYRIDGHVVPDAEADGARKHGRDAADVPPG